MSPEEAAKNLADIERTKVIINGGYFILLALFGWGVFVLAKMVIIRIGDRLGDIVELLRTIAGVKGDGPRSAKKPPKETP